MFIKMLHLKLRYKHYGVVMFHAIPLNSNSNAEQNNALWFKLYGEGTPLGISLDSSSDAELDNALRFKLYGADIIHEKE